jgi:uncharacterized protein (TIGR00369 family)
MKSDHWKEVKAYSHCFVCGEKNSTGLRIKFYSDGKVAKAEYEPTEQFSGYKNIFHGGVMAALLDEVMIKTVIANDRVAVTTKMSLAYKRPAKVGEKIFLKGEIVESRKKIVKTKGEARNREGELLAEAEGEFYVLEGELKEKLLESLKR